MFVTNQSTVNQATSFNEHTQPSGLDLWVKWTTSGLFLTLTSVASPCRMLLDQVLRSLLFSKWWKTFRTRSGAPGARSVPALRRALAPPPRVWLRLGSRYAVAMPLLCARCLSYSVQKQHKQTSYTKMSEWGESKSQVFKTNVSTFGLSDSLGVKWIEADTEIVWYDSWETGRVADKSSQMDQECDNKPVHYICT